MAVIYQGEVLKVQDEYHGNRIKVRLPQDGNRNANQIDEWAFPLLPKYLQTPLKEHDCVLVFTSDLGNVKSQRYYIGPVISQPQFMSGDSFKGGFGQANSLLQGSYSTPIETIDHFDVTDGSFPNMSDVALVGRESEDIILKDGEIDIRCGIRGEATNYVELLGKKVAFNSINPTYIQLKRTKEGDGFVNIVGDKINIMSHEGVLKAGDGSLEIANQPSLIKEEDFRKCVENLHQVPYGDVLVDVLDKLINAFNSHTHIWANEPPDLVAIDKASEALVETKDMLSDTLRIT